MNINYLIRFDRFILVVWVGIWIVLGIQFASNAPAYEAFLLSLTVVLLFYPFTTYLSNHLLKKAIQRRTVFRFILQFIAISLFMVVMILCIYVLFHYLEDINLFPKSTLFKESDTVTYGAIGALAATALINFGFCGLRFFEENLRLHKTIVDSQLQILQAQINPHFMFNVLNHINILIRKEPELASSLLVQYTDILRYQLYSGEKEFITIRQEVEFLKNFIEIEKMRWKNSLLVECLWEIENGETNIPPLLLITFVENAFKHVSRSKEEKGYVNIELRQKDNEVKLYVENSIFSADFGVSDGEQSGLGLGNIKRRLDILYPKQHSLLINKTETSYSTLLKIQLK